MACEVIIAYYHHIPSGGLRAIVSAVQCQYPNTFSPTLRAVRNVNRLVVTSGNDHVHLLAFQACRGERRQSGIVGLVR